MVIIFYGIVGEFALGVYADTSKLKISKKYVQNASINKYSNFEQAKAETIRSYNTLLRTNEFTCGYFTENEMKLDWMYHNTILAREERDPECCLLFVNLTPFSKSTNW